MGKYIFWLVVIIASSCLFLTSCTSRQKYPAEWSELILPADERCVDISGTYVNLGETAKGQGVFLSALFDFGEAPSAVTQVQIAESDNVKLEVSAWYKQKMISRKSYLRSSEEYSCSSKGVEMPLGSINKSGSSGEGGMLYLTKSTDGALIIEKKSSAGGYSLLYIPIVSSSYEWYRFKPVDIIKR
jgi:hypothetical protein